MSKSSIKSAAAALVSAMSEKRSYPVKTASHKSLSERIAVNRAMVEKMQSDRRELTDREKEVIACYAIGHSSHIASKELGISYKTFENHLQSAYRKLGVSNGRAAVSLLYEARIAELEARLRAAEKPCKPRRKSR